MTEFLPSLEWLWWERNGGCERWWIQAVNATPGGLDGFESSSSRASAGFFQFSV
ncbi:hypothetical protein APR09_003672, partial [Nocardia amikacinitolerans]|nr:hypothetical protein [Nocardia amikacinitolerans]